MLDINSKHKASHDFPDKCCNCLKDQEATLEIKSIFYKMINIVYAKSTEKSINVPICNNCIKIINKKNNIRWIIIILSGVLWLMLRLFVFSKPIFFVKFIFLNKFPVIGNIIIRLLFSAIITPINYIVTIIYGCLIGLIIANIYRNSYFPAKLTKKGITFKNKEYQNQYLGEK